MLHTLRFSLQNAVYFIMLPFLVPILFTFYIQDEAQHVSGDTPPIMRTLSGTVCLTRSTNYSSNNLPRMKIQTLPLQF